MAWPPKGPPLIYEPMSFAAPHPIESPLVEYQAARERAALLDASGRELLQLTGPDALSFLHGMVTNDIEGLPVGGVTYAAMLTPKGGMVSDVRVFRRAEDLLLEVEPGQGEKALGFLSKYLISEDAELHPATESFSVVSLWGPGSAGVLRAASGRDVAAAVHRSETVPLGSAEALVTGGWFSGEAGVDLIIPRGARESVLALLTGAGATAAQPSTWELLRVEAGLPRYGQDMTETTIPLEASLDRAIHYQKGCYIGQEVIARATFRGHVNKKLAGLLLGDAPVPPKTELFRGEKRIGFVTSVARSFARGQWIALGYVHRDSLTPGTELKAAGREAPAFVEKLPFV